MKENTREKNKEEIKKADLLDWLLAIDTSMPLPIQKESIGGKDISVQNRGYYIFRRRVIFQTH